LHLIHESASSFIFVSLARFLSKRFPSRHRRPIRARVSTVRAAYLSLAKRQQRRGRGRRDGGAQAPDARPRRASGRFVSTGVVEIAHQEFVPDAEVHDRVRARAALERRRGAGHDVLGVSRAIESRGDF
jgi:hypothetical protein|tara:strand:- start:2649 stop:3035 length:387 start_codon:yes stop_codon:yes gene_type:complete